MKNFAMVWSCSLVALVVACGGAAGVGSDSGETDASLGGSGAKAGSGSSGAGASANTGSSANGANSGTGGDGGGGAASGTGGRSFPDDSFDYDPSLDADPTSCVTESIGTERLPVDMFIMLDRSGSMTQPYGNNDSDGYCDVDDVDWQDNGSRWCNAINALADFLGATSSVGLGVAYSEFRGNGPSGCNAASSMSVPFGVIEEGDASGIIADVVDEMNDDNPDGGTPTEFAIKTLMERTLDWRDSPSNTRDVPIVALLITDGSPSSDNCNDDRDALNAMMIEHFTDTGIPFYLIGMDGVSAANLDQLATGAGASPHTDFCIDGDAECSYYSVGNGDPNTFIAALAEIQEAVMGCSFGIPSNGSGLVDLETADVVFVESNGSPAETLAQVGNLAACNSSSQYYVDGETIQLCPDTCDRVGGDSSVTIDIKCAGN